MATITAWFGANHPAQRVDCPRCEARAGLQCVVTIPMPGTCVGSGMRILGLHAERIECSSKEQR